MTGIRKCAENYSNRWRNGSHSVHSAIGIGMQLDFGCGADKIGRTLYYYLSSLVSANIDRTETKLVGPYQRELGPN